MFLHVSALYVDAEGPYPGLVPDFWDVTRDARGYEGTNPVVAHPPCQLWTNFAALNYKRWGGEHNRPGNDGGMFLHALSTVRRLGGVLKHPASSNAWPAFGLPRPSPEGGWSPTACGGWVCEVWQSAYGHKARKKTWLYYVGIQPPIPANFSRAHTHTHQVVKRRPVGLRKVLLYT